MQFASNQRETQRPLLSMTFQNFDVSAVAHCYAPKPNFFKAIGLIEFTAALWLSRKTNKLAFSAKNLQDFINFSTSFL